MHLAVYTNVNNTGSQYFPGNNEASRPLQREWPLAQALNNKDVRIIFKGRVASEPQVPVPDLIVQDFRESEEFLWKHDPEEARTRYDSL